MGQRGRKIRASKVNSRLWSTKNTFSLECSFVHHDAENPCNYRLFKRTPYLEHTSCSCWFSVVFRAPISKKLASSLLTGMLFHYQLSLTVYIVIISIIWKFNVFRNNFSVQIHLVESAPIFILGGNHGRISIRIKTDRGLSTLSYLSAIYQYADEGSKYPRWWQLRTILFHCPKINPCIANSKWKKMGKLIL